MTPLALPGFVPFVLSGSLAAAKVATNGGSECGKNAGLLLLFEKR